MLSKSTLLHLRIPFSYYLLPIFLFSFSISPNLPDAKLLWIFIILHFFLYPASNGFNSYFDKDEKSIGGLKNPPKVNNGLYWMSLLFDLIAILLGAFKVSLLFAIMILIYGLVSKAYSHPMIRLKKYPVVGLFVTGLFQGAFTVMLCYVGINDFDLQNVIQPKVLFAGLTTSLMLWGSYPMTQIYQHEEDEKHGDKTISRLLGIRGTFYFTAALFGFASLSFVFFFKTFYDIKFGWIFLATLSPVVLFFGIWFLMVLRNPEKANYRNTMLLNFISATCLSVFFIYFYLTSTGIINVITGK